jgi:hypothetical protein
LERISFPLSCVYARRTDMGLANAAVTVSFWAVVPRSAACLAVACGFDDRRYLPAATGACGKRRVVVRARGDELFSPLCCLRSLGGPLDRLPGRVPHDAELVLITVCAGMSAGGSVLLAPVYPAALAYMATILVPLRLQMLVPPRLGYTLLGLLALSFAAFLVAVIATTARLSVERTQAVRHFAVCTAAAGSGCHHQRAKHAFRDGTRQHDPGSLLL